MEIEEITIIEIITGPITEINQEADGTITGQVIGVTIYQTNNRRGNARPNYGQDAQWTFRNRSQSRNRAGNYNNDHMRGGSRDRHDNRSVQFSPDKAHYLAEEMNLGLDLTLE